jgi:hypothetical protein
MADDARISTALPAHPKTRKLRKRLGVEGCWALVCLLLWVVGNRADGNLAGLSDEDIELAADWNGKAGAFVLALAEVGFLDGSADSYVVHDWQDHNPWAASRGQRVEAARKAARVRWDGACAPHADRIAESCGPHETAMPTTQPNPTQPDHTVKSKPKSFRTTNGTRIPQNFAVSREHCEWATEENLPDPNTCIAAFKDYWKARPGAGGLKLDWDATFRNWIRTAAERNGGGNGRSESNARRAERESHEAINKAAANLRRRHGIGEVNGVGAGNVIETNTH